MIARAKMLVAVGLQSQGTVKLSYPKIFVMTLESFCWGKYYLVKGLVLVIARALLAILHSQARTLHLSLPLHSLTSKFLVHKFYLTPFMRYC